MGQGTKKKKKRGLRRTLGVLGQNLSFSFFVCACKLVWVALEARQVAHRHEVVAVVAAVIVSKSFVPYYAFKLAGVLAPQALKRRR